MFEFHISRQARDRYQFDQGLFSLRGNVIFANFHASRLFAQKMNQARDLVTFPEQAVRASQINAMGLIDEILHHALNLYQENRNPQAMLQAMAWLESRLGKSAVDRALLEFTKEFPPLVVYQGKQSPMEYLAGQTDGKPNQAIALEELLMLWVANKNPACEPFHELFDDDRLVDETVYSRIMMELYNFFETQPKFGPAGQNIIDMLRSPAIAVPNSLSGQLDYIRTHWAELLGRYLYRMLTSLDFLKEEERIPFLGPGPALIPVFRRGLFGSGEEGEPEKFSPDREWMPNLILIAKNSYVWLDQLSKKYQRSITRLDQIPDEELDQLASWGFTGLWLIGLWERSKASAVIKQLCGNPEAIASAYSLANYVIANDLGGEESYLNLRDRAWQRGIRLASDMVPNHMGIDSSWVIDHPEWFISLDYSPYPAYSFTGPDLSPDPRISIHIEDHYYDRTDAAVVFKRYDHRSGETRYIYHGNDGTSMPWNDTAQLDYLNPQVREAVIQTILSVARRFPIIRFDAAMTLAKRHYQRLWFPEPGTGGAIPTRADHGLTKEQFDAAMPVEFWREVVDRAAVEAPDTLLLAEAFWLMEGYFVRTLGMHRVYNSAFMNMLRNEDNAKYRQVIKNTLEFDPEILKRYVNFMNNPDERTAVEQFGKGDKYFGICTLLATLPGMPMFGHGQVEGFSEKYGMEYRRAYWDEQVDTYLVDRHKREIFPLLHQRALFAGVEHFLLYDFFTSEGGVNEDVYAYSNGRGNERALVVYHNRFADARGWIRTSVGFSVKTGSGDQRLITQRTLAEGLGIQPRPNSFVIFRDQASQLEYIRTVSELVSSGFYIELHAYETHVFVDFRQVDDDDWQSYRQLYSYLAGRGVPNIQDALRELVIRPVLEPYRMVANSGYWQFLKSNVCSKANIEVSPFLLSEAKEKMGALVNGIIYLNPSLQTDHEILQLTSNALNSLLSFPVLSLKYPAPGLRNAQRAFKWLNNGFLVSPQRWYPWFAWVFLHNLAKLNPAIESESQVLSWMDQWNLNKVLLEAFISVGMDAQSADHRLLLVRLLVQQKSWHRKHAKSTLKTIMESWLSIGEVRYFLGINRYQDRLWFNQEAFEEFIWSMSVLAVLDVLEDESATSTQIIEQILGVYEISQHLLKAEKKSKYQLNLLLAQLK